MKHIGVRFWAVLSAAVLCFSAFPAEAETGKAAGTGSGRVSMDFENADLKIVLKLLSQQSGMNFVSSQDAENKKVSVFLSDVSVDDAMDAIVRSNGLRYEMKPKSNIFMVYAAEEQGEMQTRVFPLKFLRLSISSIDVGGQSVSRELLRKEDAAALSGGGTGGSAAANPSGDSGGAGDKGGEKEEKLTAARGADKLVASLLSEHGKVAVDANSNSLIVTDLPEKLAAVEAVLSRLDVAPKQVMLEAQALEVRSGLLDNEGVEWGGSDGALGTFVGPVRDTRFPFGGNDWIPRSGQYVTGQDAQSGSSEEGGSLFTFGRMDLSNFTATLRFILEQSDTRILAKPRVLTMNNEAAVVKLVTNTAIAQSATITSSQNIATQTTDAIRQETGIVLKMTPQVNVDNSVTLFLEPSVTTVAVSTFFPSDFLDPTTRSVRTAVRVRSGETLVIGGLQDMSESRTDKKVPFLGDVPVMGRLFRSEGKDDSKRELVIFITPTVTDMSQTEWKREQNPVAARDQEMDQALQTVGDRQAPPGPPAVGD